MRGVDRYTTYVSHIQDQHLRMTVDKSKRKCVHSVHHHDNGHLPAGACHEAMLSADHHLFCILLLKFWVEDDLSQQVFC